MVYTWQSADHKRCGVDDMTLLSDIKESAIVENLKKRFLDDWIFTYIGPVLISVNPFKQMKYFTQRETEMYQGAAQYENPPHVYALADNMYRNMTIDNENQCVIISGESGAGKTVAAKYIMNYLSQVSGGGDAAQHVKEVILQSNPLLEAFGNAKTVRNNNSSRFGKYVEILFTSGLPVGGKISNFLLEKSRVVTQNPQERSFHVFYQLCRGMDRETKEQFGVAEPDYYCYLNMHGCYKDERTRRAQMDRILSAVDGTDDAGDYSETIRAMDTMNMSADEQSEVLQLVSGILHLGNVLFREEGSDVAVVDAPEMLDFPSYLLQVDKAALAKKLTSRIMESKWGATTERLDVTCNVQQAEATRDALAKGLYSRLFDYLVKRVNQAMELPAKYKQTNLLNIGILDIYGFEIFQKNGFEQFCINFVNEKLQQIFIELTLKAEQEEYVSEGIQWKAIDYFNNAIVCQLIEEKLPKPGVLAVLDDVCASQHGVKEGADSNLKSKLRENCRHNKHFGDTAEGFAIHHYAGVVNYDVDGFVDRNKDTFNVDLVELMQASASAFVRSLFPETVDRSSKKRPITAGAKIKKQANELVASLMSCTPHYIRCIKPNETKRPRDWEQERVRHQVEYLGLKENIRVRRAGFAYRRPFEKFLHRYALLTKETWPHWRGDVRQGVQHVLRSVNMSQDEYQMGKSKLFIKAPESLFLLEERREKKFDYYARVLQKAFKKYFNQQKFLREKEEAADIFFQRKERRRHSLNRNFYGDYLGLDAADGGSKPGLRSAVGKRDRVEFAQTVTRYDKRVKGINSAKRDLVVTARGVFLVGREVDKSGPNKGQAREVVSRQISFGDLQLVSLSTRQDDFVVLHVNNSYDSLLQVPFKTELVTVLKRLVQARLGRDLRIAFSDKIEFASDKSRLTGGKKRSVTFVRGGGDLEAVSAPGFLKNEIRVEIGDGLPNTSKPRRDVSKRRGGGGRHQHQQQPTRQPTHQLDRAPSARPSRTAPTVPPPSSAAPASQPRHRPSVKRTPMKHLEQPSSPVNGGLSFLEQLKQNQLKNKGHSMKRQESMQMEKDANMNFLMTPAGGQSKATRESIRGSPAFASPQERPLPAGGRPKPTVKKAEKKPRVRALYDYQAQDTDEISLVEGEVLELMREDDSGWWTGKTTGGLEGFFPGSYVEKI